MQRKKAVELRQASGDRPCAHPAFSREYDQGERTGNYCCTQCGAAVTLPAEVRDHGGPRRSRHSAMIVISTFVRLMHLHVILARLRRELEVVRLTGTEVELRRA